MCPRCSKIDFIAKCLNTFVAHCSFHAAPLSWSNWNLEMLVSVEEGKPEPGKKPSEQGKNQQQTQSTHSTQPLRWEVSALTTAPSLLPSVIENSFGCDNKWKLDKLIEKRTLTSDVLTCLVLFQA